MLHRFFIWCGADLGLPIQFHVGYGDRDIDLHRCNPLLLTGLLRALEPTGVPVMLLHNYPYHREAGYLAQVFPLVYADLGLATHNVGARATALLGEALELVPLRKFLFSSDAFGLPELYYLGTHAVPPGAVGVPVGPAGRRRHELCRRGAHHPPHRRRERPPGLPAARLGRSLPHGLRGGTRGGQACSLAGRARCRRRWPRRWRTASRVDAAGMPARSKSVT